MARVYDIKAFVEARGKREAHDREVAAQTEREQADARRATLFRLGEVMAQAPRVVQLLIRARVAPDIDLWTPRRGAEWLYGVGFTRRLPTHRVVSGWVVAESVDQEEVGGYATAAHELVVANEAGELYGVRLSPSPRRREVLSRADGALLVWFGGVVAGRLTELNIPGYNPVHIDAEAIDAIQAGLDDLVDQAVNQPPRPDAQAAEPLS